MKYTIALCDDSAADRTYISGLVKKWSDHTQFPVQIAEFVSAENFLFHYDDKNDYDILLLDIEMGDMDGVTMAKKLRRKNDSIQIIFITGYSDYICEGYEVEALHYLIKPVKEEKLYTVLNRAVEKISKNEKILYLESNGEMHRIPIYQIRYASVNANYVTIHATEDITLKMTLSELKKEMDDRFYRVSRSDLVNLTCISRVTKKEVILNDKTAIPLPRGSYEKINRAIINFS